MSDPAENCSSRGERTCYKVGHSYGGVLPLFLGAEFRNDRLVSVLMTFPTTRFSELTAAMRERYGAPDQNEGGTVQNRMGAAFDNRKLTWVRGRVRLEVEQRTAKLDEASVLLLSKSFLNEMENERSDKAKEAAKGL